MDVRLPDRLAEVSETQSLKASLPRLERSEKLTAFSRLQPSKALLAIFCTLFKSMETSASQSSKAPFPISVTLDGRLMDSMFLQPLNASASMDLMLSGRETSFSASQPLKTALLIFFRLPGS